MDKNINITVSLGVPISLEQLNRKFAERLTKDDLVSNIIQQVVAENNLIQMSGNPNNKQVIIKGTGIDYSYNIPSQEMKSVVTEMKNEVSRILNEVLYLEGNYPIVVRIINLLNKSDSMELFKKSISIVDDVRIKGCGLRVFVPSKNNINTLNELQVEPFLQDNNKIFCHMIINCNFDDNMENNIQIEYNNLNEVLESITTKLG